MKEKQFEISVGIISWKLRNLISSPRRVSDNYTHKQSQLSIAWFTSKKPFRRKARLNEKTKKKTCIFENVSIHCATYKLLKMTQWFLISKRISWVDSRN